VTAAIIETEMAISEPSRSLLSGASVLVVDDDQITLRALVRTLRLVGAQVFGAPSPHEARARAATGALDAAVIDLRLADARGGPLILELRAQAEPCSALLITGSRGVDATREAIAVGAEEILFKPFEANGFLEAVARTVARTKTWRSTLSSVEQGAHAATVGSEIDANTFASTSAIKLEPKRRIVEERPLGESAFETLAAVDIDRYADELTRMGDLSERERAILVLVLRGMRNAEIALQTSLKERTVKFHVSNIYRKLRVSGRIDLARFLF
jgi:DNA-binding NarL/FixJ family response regulator